MNVIKYDSGIPLYIQLQGILKEKILNGEYGVDEQIPPENELCETYNVSRITVRKAIETLVQEKLLYRLQGKGTFVTPLKLRRNLPKLYSFSEDMRELGLVPDSQVLEQCVEETDEAVRTLLQLPEAQTQVTKLSRVRLANNEPLLIEHAYIPLYLCPDLIHKDLAKGSLYQIFRDHYQLSLEYAEENYEVTVMNKREARILKCHEHAPAFSIERITFLDTKVPIELTRAIGRGDRLRFSVKLVKDTDTQFRRNVDL